MTPEDIKKLPTRETDALMNPRGGHTGDLVGKTRSLEQQRDALMMRLEESTNLIRHYASEFGQPNFTDRYGDEERCRKQISKNSETLASIRQMKEKL